ncbi:flagellar hook-length control protein FliK [Nereida sp. MMG025]|uniref:flagellar hook-length control protein FliK n=1 Tax=Nereida sp. MMG025 TaxID=2909981 RepID=UPI001F18181A|nr:flagellar hook-length control protein FliK [Nereida sp. MMG025]MCF6444693.1 flagellar hook-length control protein FliK [Nereida sp. MMG025]
MQITLPFKISGHVDVSLEMQTDPAINAETEGFADLVDLQGSDIQMVEEALPEPLPLLMQNTPQNGQLSAEFSPDNITAGASQARVVLPQSDGSVMHARVMNTQGREGVEPEARRQTSPNLPLGFPISADKTEVVGQSIIASNTARVPNEKTVLMSAEVEFPGRIVEPPKAVSRAVVGHEATPKIDVIPPRLLDLSNPDFDGTRSEKIDTQRQVVPSEPFASGPIPSGDVGSQRIALPEQPMTAPPQAHKAASEPDTHMNHTAADDPAIPKLAEGPDPQATAAPMKQAPSPFEGAVALPQPPMDLQAVSVRYPDSVPLRKSDGGAAVALQPPTVPKMTAPNKNAMPFDVPQPIHSQTPIEFPQTDVDHLPLAAERSVLMTAAPVALDAPVTTMPANAPRQVAQQLAEAFNLNATGMTELTLNPEELGRVRITFSGGDAGMVVMLQSERPETQDMLRRNVDLLMQEFENAGYETLNFAFGQNGANNGEQEQASSQDVSDEPVLDGPPEKQMPRTTAQSGIDIRL